MREKLKQFRRFAAIICIVTLCIAQVPLSFADTVNEDAPAGNTVVTDLDSNQLRITEESQWVNKAAKIGQIQLSIDSPYQGLSIRDRKNMDIIFVVDNSSAMNGSVSVGIQNGDRLKEAKAALKTSIDMLLEKSEDNNKVGLITINGVKDEIQLTSDGTSLKSEVDGINTEDQVSYQTATSIAAETFKEIKVEESKYW